MKLWLIVKKGKNLMPLLLTKKHVFFLFHVFNAVWQLIKYIYLYWKVPNLFAASRQLRLWSSCLGVTQKTMLHKHVLMHTGTYTKPHFCCLSTIAFKKQWHASLHTFCRCIVRALKDPNTFLFDHLLILKPVRFLEGELIHDVSAPVSTKGNAELVLVILF